MLNSLYDFCLSVCLLVHWFSNYEVKVSAALQEKFLKMNDRAGKRMFDENLLEKLPIILNLMKKNFDVIEKVMEICKNALTECGSTVDELRSDMAELESMVQEISSKNTKSSLDISDASRSIQRRKRKINITEPDIIEEITIDKCEENEDSSSTFKKKYYQRKKQKTNQYVEDTFSDDEIYVITQETDEEPGVPGPSRILKNSKNKQSHDSDLIIEKEITTTEAHLKEDVVEKALKKSSGVLSEEQLSTFLYLADTLEDPVQVAKLSFTSDIKMLYYQLKTFHFHLKIANDVAENEKGTWCTNRELENKVQRLVHIFQKEIL